MPDAVASIVPIYKGILIEWIGRVLGAIIEGDLSIDGSSQANLIMRTTHEPCARLSV